MYRNKKVLLMLFCCFRLLFATGIDSDSYKNAINYYKEGNYQKSYLLLKKLRKKSIDNVDINYYLARSAFELKKYEDAISAYERILIKDPKNIRVRLELARAYFGNGNLKYAKEEFEKVLKRKIPENVRKNVKAYLITIDKAKKRNFINGALIAGIGYDSNVNSSPDDDKYFVPGLGAVVSSGVKNVSDWHHQEVLVINDIYDIGARGGYAVKNSFLVMNRIWNKHNDKNVFFVQYSPSILYENDKKGYDISLIANKMWYGSDPYIYSLGLNPKIWYKYSKRVLFRGGLKYQWKYYQPQKNHNKNSKLFTILINPVVKINKSISIYPAFSFLSERKVRGSLTNVDRDKYLASIRLFKKFDKRLSGSLSYSFDQVKYKDIDLAFNNKRDDKESIVGADLTYILPMKFILNGGVNYIKNNSNQAPYEYDKYTFKISIIKPF